MGAVTFKIPKECLPLNGCRQHSLPFPAEEWTNCLQRYHKWLHGHHGECSWWPTTESKCGIINTKLGHCGVSPHARTHTYTPKIHTCTTHTYTNTRHACSYTHPHANTHAHAHAHTFTSCTHAYTYSKVSLVNQCTLMLDLVTQCILSSHGVLWISTEAKCLHKFSCRESEDHFERDRHSHLCLP